VADVARWSARRCSASGAHLTLGEGPVWDEAAQCVRWVDIAAGSVFRGVLDGDSLVADDVQTIDATVGAVLLAQDGGLVVAGVHDLHLLSRAGDRTGSIPVIEATVHSRLNDAICDTAGRLLVGSLALDGRTGAESVFRVEPDGATTTLLTGLTLANGMGFSPDGTEFYLIDSIPGVIHAYEYDVSTGAVGRRRTLWQEAGYVPDGLTVDAEGMLWVAYFGAGALLRLTPAGELAGRVDVPAPNTTCPAFVGPERDRLLITTAREQLSADQLSQWPDSGGVFVVEPGVRGLPSAAWGGSTMRKTVD
jgi:sugar lactone lactonase YvrE